jgi:hypothetical protein
MNRGFPLHPSLKNAGRHEFCGLIFRPLRNASGGNNLPSFVVVPNIYRNVVAMICEQFARRGFSLFFGCKGLRV